MPLDSCVRPVWLANPRTARLRPPAEDKSPATWWSGSRQGRTGRGCGMTPRLFAKLKTKLYNSVLCGDLMRRQIDNAVLEMALVGFNAISKTALSICLRIKSPHRTELYSFVLSLANSRGVMPQPLPVLPRSEEHTS